MTRGIDRHGKNQPAFGPRWPARIADSPKVRGLFTSRYGKADSGWRPWSSRISVLVPSWRDGTRSSKPGSINRPWPTTHRRGSRRAEPGRADGAYRRPAAPPASPGRTRTSRDVGRPGAAKPPGRPPGHSRELLQRDSRVHQRTKRQAQQQHRGHSPGGDRREVAPQRIAAPDTRHRAGHRCVARPRRPLAVRRCHGAHQ